MHHRPSSIKDKNSMVETSDVAPGRMMAALLEMLLSRTKLPVDQQEVTPVKQLEHMIKELEILRLPHTLLTACDSKV